MNEIVGVVTMRVNFVIVVVIVLVVMFVTINFPYV